MRRIQIALLVVVAVVLVWIGAAKYTAAQVPVAVSPLSQSTGRFSLSLVPGVGGPNGGYYAILLDTQNGKMWSSVGMGAKINDFEPVRGPMDPHRPPPVVVPGR